MHFSQDELLLTDERLSEFPVDASDSVCPMDAILWERGMQFPLIDEERCINCGICARRCPIGAIYSNGANAVIHANEDYVEFLPVTHETEKRHRETLLNLKEIKHDGSFQTVSERSLGIVYGKLNEQQTGVQFPNLIVRNFFLVLGNQCIIRRHGDVYFRIDSIIADKPVIGVAEVEFHKDTLESPRAILDDIAVLSSRYEIEKTQIKPFIISLEFPNTRTEYWRVIKDIKDVLGVRVHSLTLGALCMLAWSFEPVPIGGVDFYADVDMPSIKDAIEKACGKGKLPNFASIAILEPTK
jgi:ferredoxin